MVRCEYEAVALAETQVGHVQDWNVGCVGCNIDVVAGGANPYRLVGCDCHEQVVLCDCWV